jgi:hypothetical protein
MLNTREESDALRAQAGVESPGAGAGAYRQPQSQPGQPADGYGDDFEDDDDLNDVPF